MVSGKAGGQRRRAPTVDVDGVVLLDKPEGLSSNAALQRARRSFSAAKAGHTGTLDPMASGLLPVCLGDATKFSQGLLDADKGYLATALLGVATDTGDREGKVVAQRPVDATAAQVVAALASLTGPLEQVPPMYSALKHQGQPLYAIARAGGDVARAPRAVVIHALDLVEWDNPRLTFSVSCSKGTYVRTLAEQIAERLGTVAHLIALRRTAVGPFTLGSSVTLAALEATESPQRLQYLRPVDTLVESLPAVMLCTSDALALLQGRALQPCPAASAAMPAGGDPPVLVRLYGPSRLPGLRGAAGSDRAFLGVGAVESGPDGAARVRPMRLIAHAASHAADENDAICPPLGERA
jgi:tRNA pseudouridine55 synthase